MACAICCLEGGWTTAVGEAMVLSSVPGAHGGDHRKAGTQTTRQVRIVEGDLHGDSLDDFRKVAGGVVGREKRKLRAAGGRNFEHFPAEDFARVLINVKLGGVAHFHVA